MMRQITFPGSGRAALLPLSLSRGMSPQMALLPSCTAAGVASVAVTSGCIGLMAQVALTFFFKQSKDPFLSRAPGYAAHQAIALLLMSIVSAFGLVGWVNPPAAATATAAARLLMPSDQARWLGAMLLGMLVAWDIPSCVRIGRLRKADTLAHHVGMAAVALVGATSLPTRYGLYYMGVAELSSIPLTLYDGLDAALEVSSSGARIDASEGGEASAGARDGSNGAAVEANNAYAPERRDALRRLRDAMRTVAAVAFILVRALDFSHVTLFHFLPDVLAVLCLEPTAIAGVVWPLRFMLVSSLGFVGLQLYWLSLFIRISLAERKREARRRERS